MKFKTSIIIIFIILFVGTIWGKDSILFVVPSDDSYTRKDLPNNNYGGLNQVNIGTWAGAGEYIGWIKFNKRINDSIPVNAVIDSAFLVVSPSWISGLCTLFVATPAGGYSEGTITFNNQPDSVLTYVSDTLTAANWDTMWRWDITRIVNEYHGGALDGLDTTRGFVILDVSLDDPALNGLQVRSSEYGQEEPWFVIYYGSGELTGIIPKVYSGAIQSKVTSGVIQPKVRAP